MNATAELFSINAKLVEQPTWGGDYIAKFKQLSSTEFKNKKIGQSYELYGLSCLNEAQTNRQILMSDLVRQNPRYILGPTIAARYTNTMPLLIKFTQAMGNSFQLHRKQNITDPRWLPKAESWFYLEDGLLTYGIRKGTRIEEYRQACMEIEQHMALLSTKVQSNTITLQDAKEQAKTMIHKIDPWQFVNVHTAKKNTLIDLSPGGIHHSWEEDPVNFPLGNIVYEVQQDVSDAQSSLRSFDKGKLNDEGKVRPVYIQDYFRFLDTSPELNEFSFSLREPQGTRLLKTPHYSLDSLTTEKPCTEYIAGSFVHLFVTRGNATIKTRNSELVLEKGYSCFIPYSSKQYEVSPKDSTVSLLKTYIDP